MIFGVISRDEGLKYLDYAFENLAKIPKHRICAFLLALSVDRMLVMYWQLREAQKVRSE